MHGSAERVRDVTFAQRAAGAGGVVWFYLSKALLPIRLAFVYPQWRIDAGNLLWWLPWIGMVLLTAALFFNRRGILGRGRPSSLGPSIASACCRRWVSPTLATCDSPWSPTIINIWPCRRGCACSRGLDRLASKCPTLDPLLRRRRRRGGRAHAAYLATKSAVRRPDRSLLGSNEIQPRQLHASQQSGR